MSKPSLPDDDDTAIAPKTEPVDGATPSPQRILIADDDLSIREALAQVLEGEHYQVLQAKSGREAVVQFMRAAPDLVLLDLNMPDEDGWEAFEQMEKLRPFAPMIVITARPNQYEHAARRGIDALMEKPLDLPLLLQTIKGLLAESEAQRVARLTKRNFTTFFLLRRDAMKSPQRSSALPAPSRPPERNQAEPDSASGPSRKRIMIADDDPSVSASLGCMLEAENYDVVFAYDGREAASKHLTAPYDLLARPPHAVSRRLAGLRLDQQAPPLGPHHHHHGPAQPV